MTKRKACMFGHGESCQAIYCNCPNQDKHMELKHGKIYEVVKGIEYQANFTEAIEAIIIGYGIDQRLEIDSSSLASYVADNLDNIYQLKKL